LICGLILAAGAGTRFGSEPKLLAPLDGRPLLERAIAAQCAVGELERIVVVLGAFSDELLAEVEFGRALPVLCSDWEAGQSVSLRFGLDALPGASKVIVTLGDEPLITAEVIRRFLELPAGSRAVYDGRPAHPVVLGPEQIQRLAAVRGDRGANELLGGGPEVECSDLASGCDVDTTQDLEEIRNEARAVL
jgi:molybdenum cofactor cytidylyltransferase